MTDEEKEILIGCIETANVGGDYVEMIYLEGMIHGLNIHRGKNEKISLVNGRHLYEGDKLMYTWEPC